MIKRFTKGLAAITVFCALTATYVLAVQAANVSVSNDPELRRAVANAGTTPTTITFTANIEMSSSFIIPEGADITLTSAGGNMFSLITTRDLDSIIIDGYVPRRRSGISVIIIDGQVHHNDSTSPTINTSLTLNNIGVTRIDGTRGIGVRNNGGNLTMNSGIISGHNRNSHGVVITEGAFTMNGGTISRNRSNGGGAVFIGGGTAVFIMNGGTISENYSGGGSHGGGGVSI